MNKSSTKKQKTQQHNSVTAAAGGGNSDSQKEEYVGRRVAKYFGMALYAGTVVEYFSESEMGEPGEGEMWNIRFDDGDEEDVGETELVALLELYQQNRRLFFIVGGNNNNQNNNNSNHNNSSNPSPPGK
jgi:hypothetical protein